MSKEKLSKVPVGRRQTCVHCLRPLKTCLCAGLKSYVPYPIQQQTPILILQHPSEVKQAKGTARLAQLSLSQTDLWVGERFDAKAIVDWTQSEPTYLVFPKLEGGDLPSVPIWVLPQQISQIAQPCRLIFLDGTWKKARKLLYLNPILHSLPRLILEDVPASNYRIRQQKGGRHLSTIEAIQGCLAILEKSPEKYQPLNGVLEVLNQQVAHFNQGCSG